jgi:hypothetical protein
MKLISRFILATGMVFLPHLVQAQISITGGVNNDLAPVRPDTVVQVAADSQGLQLVLPEQVPASGTFWWVMPGGMAIPTPCPPQDLSGAIYQIADGQFLVDETGGQMVVNQRRLGLQVQVTSSLVASAAVSQADALVNLITQVQTTTENQASQTRLLASSMDVSGPPTPGDGSGSGGTNSSNGGTGYVMPDYGTNLWIAQVAVTSGNLTGIGTNTQAYIQYDILSRTNLLQTDWQTENSIFGSETTNWTPFSVAQNNRTNLFIRLRSDASSDGSGLPDWWELEYFGTNGVDPYGNPAGDGYGNLQKFQNGMNPNVFYTPPAPQGVTAALNQENNTAKVSWLPQSGAVTSYTVEKTDSYTHPATVQVFSVASNSSSYQDSLANNTATDWSASPYSWYDDTYQVSYRVQAQYSSGYSSSWSPSVPVQPATVTATIVPGTNGETYLEVAGIPNNAATVRLVTIFLDFMTFDSDIVTTIINHDIPVTDFTNGSCPLPADWASAVTDPNTNDSVILGCDVRSIDTNGNPSAAAYVDGNWGTAFYNGQAQMKQNLIFQLRAASVDAAFYYTLHLSGWVFGRHYCPSNYVYAGLYPFLSGNGYYDNNYIDIDPCLPFEENCTFRNFVFNMANVDKNGSLTTGVGWDTDFALVTLSASPSYQYSLGGSDFPNLLATNASRWLYYDQLENNRNLLAATGINVDLDQKTISMPANVRNWFGLPYITAMLVYDYYDDNENDLGLATNVLNAGAALTLPGDNIYTLESDYFQNIYPETDQPKFQTVNYCFYNATTDLLPGAALFSPKKDSPQLYYTVKNDLPVLIVPAGKWTQIAGYAKLAVLNAYPGVYAYLGQYFDKAYQGGWQRQCDHEPDGSTVTLRLLFRH